MENKKKFHDAISPLLEKKLQDFLSKNQNKKFDLHICVCIYNEIFQIISDVITKSEIRLTNEAVNYLSQQYYDGVLINNQYELDPNIFTKRASLDNIDTPELRLLAVLLKGTDFFVPIAEKLRSR